MRSAIWYPASAPSRASSTRTAGCERRRAACAAGPAEPALRRRWRALGSSSATSGPVDVDVLEHALEERVGLVLVEVAGVHELAGEDLLGLREHLLLAGREPLVGVADGEVADHLGDLEDVAGLELVAVVLVATAPVLGHLGGVAAQDLEDLVDDVGLDDLAQAGAVGVLDRDHDGHVVVQDLDGEVVALLAEHVLLLDLHDLAGAVMRIDDLVSDLNTSLKPPTSSFVAPAAGLCAPSSQAELRARHAGRPRPRHCAAGRGVHRRPARRRASKPARPASATRRSLWLQERSSPVRLISPNTATRGGSGSVALG